MYEYIHRPYPDIDTSAHDRYQAIKKGKRDYGCGGVPLEFDVPCGCWSSALEVTKESDIEVVGDTLQAFPCSCSVGKSIYNVDRHIDT